MNRFFMGLCDRIKNNTGIEFPGVGAVMSSVINDVGELSIMGTIVSERWFESDVTPLDFRRELKNIGKVSELHVRINSPGGSVFAGLAIRKMLADFPGKVVSHVDGIAASIASVIMMPSDRIVMSPGSFVMIHEPMSWTFGYAEDMQKEAAVLIKIRDEIADMYAKRTGSSVDEILDMMKAETYMNGKDAVALGFADEIDEERKDKAVNIENVDAEGTARMTACHIAALSAKVNMYKCFSHN